MIMKTLKILFIFVLVSFFSFGNSFGQSNKNKTVEFLDDYPMELDLTWCTGEVLSGTLDVYITTWYDRKTQIKFKGTLTGETSNEVYTISQVSDDNFFPYTGTGQFNANYVLVLSVELDGMPVATVHETWHATRNANGELIVVFDHWAVECY